VHTCLLTEAEWTTARCRASQNARPYAQTQAGLITKDAGAVERDSPNRVSARPTASNALPRIALKRTGPQEAGDSSRSSRTVSMSTGRRAARPTAAGVFAAPRADAGDDRRQAIAGVRAAREAPARRELSNEEALGPSPWREERRERGRVRPKRARRAGERDRVAPLCEARSRGLRSTARVGNETARRILARNRGGVLRTNNSFNSRPLHPNTRPEQLTLEPSQIEPNLRLPGLVIRRADVGRSHGGMARRRRCGRCRRDGRGWRR